MHPMGKFIAVMYQKSSHVNYMSNYLNQTELVSEQATEQTTVEGLNESKPLPCKHCEGKGYIEIRDCSAEVQREETCSFCNGRGEVITE
jgi:DnaJ-class molecular chaperone